MAPGPQGAGAVLLQLRDGHEGQASLGLQPVNVFIFDCVHQLNTRNKQQ